MPHKAEGLSVVCVSVGVGAGGGKELYLFDFILSVFMQGAPRTTPQNN